MASYILLEQARHVEALVLDVDGILSDGFVTLTNTGDEIKSFDIRDGLGMKLVQQAGVKVIIITGRKSNIVEKRMSDLGVDLVFQGREDKGIALREACAQLNIAPEDCLYMGDDWPDLPVMRPATLACAPVNAHIEVISAAHFVTSVPGGHGAVRELCDLLLVASGRYAELLGAYTA